MAIREELQRQAVRIVLRTGQPGLAPERDVIVRYDINDYRLKTDLTAQTLFTTVIAALRGYSEIMGRLRAEEAAVLANRAKTEFLANINHELRTPLNAIIGLAELMDNEVFGGLANETYRGFVRDIITSGKALNETLGAILDVANIEFTNLKLMPENLSAATLFQRVIKPMAPQAARAGVSIAELVPDDLPMIWGDGRRLRQMLLNLVSNAIRYTAHGGVLVVCRTRAGCGVVEIWDTGIGMPQASGSDPYQGLGMGLTVARQLTRVLGLSLSFASRPGRGTVFRLTLPLAMHPLAS